MPLLEIGATDPSWYEGSVRTYPLAVGDGAGEQGHVAGDVGAVLQRDNVGNVLHDAQGDTPAPGLDYAGAAMSGPVLLGWVRHAQRNGAHAFVGDPGAVASFQAGEDLEAGDAVHFQYSNEQAYIYKMDNAHDFVGIVLQQTILAGEWGLVRMYGQVIAKYAAAHTPEDGKLVTTSDGRLTGYSGTNADKIVGRYLEFIGTQDQLYVIAFIGYTASAPPVWQPYTEEE
jgi:hypothetical protein